MAPLPNKFVGIIIVLLQMAPLTQCFCDWRVPYFPVYYPEAGLFFTLDVRKFSKQEYSWHKDGKQLVLQNCIGHLDEDPNCTQPIYSIRDEMDLHFKKITFQDSGKYILEALCTGIKRVSSFEIIVQDKPFVVSDCKDMTVKEGENLTCVCKTTSGYSSAEVTWTRSKAYQEHTGLNTSSGVLRLENISKNHSGTYSCFANSQDLANTTSFNLEVVSEFSSPPILPEERVRIQSFDVFQNAGFGNSKLTMTCNARGFPEPTYTILHNRIPVAHEDRHIIDIRNKSNLGGYECMAENSISSDKRLVFITHPFSDEEKIEILTLVEMNCKIPLIVGAGSFSTGILFTTFLVFCFKKFKKDKNSENSIYEDVSPQNAQVTLELNSVNREVRLRHTSTSPGNEEVQHSEAGASPDYINVGNMTDHVDCYDNETGYQELSGLRETDDGIYESLNDANEFE